MITISKTARLSALFTLAGSFSVFARDTDPVSLESLKACDSAVPERVAQKLRECLNSSKNFEDFHACAPSAGFETFFAETLQEIVVHEADKGDAICPEIEAVLKADQYDPATEAKIKRELAACKALQEVLRDIRKEFKF